MSDKVIFVASKTFCALYSHSKFLKNTCEAKKAWMFAKENNLTDVFHGFEPLGNLIKWLELRLQVLGWQTYSKSALFPFYTNFMFLSLARHKIYVFPV